MFSIFRIIQGWVKLKGSNGNFIGNIGDALKVTGINMTSSDIMLEISKGTVAGHAAVNKFGNSPDIGNNYETIWDGANKYPWSTWASAGIVEIDSDDSSDTSAGTGARTVEIYGLDANHALQNETVTLNGTTPVNSVNTYIRLFRMKVATAGSQGENDGDIFAKRGGVTIARIESGNNQTLMALYTVPAGKTAYLTSYYWSTGEDKKSTARLLVRPYGGVFQVKHQNSMEKSNYIQQNFAPYYKFEEKSDIEVEGKGDVDNNGFAAGFDLILVDN